jgi:hypothetical protein
VWPVHAGERHVVAHQAAADLERREVAGDDDDAAAARTRGLDVFDAFHDQVPAHRRDRTPPGACELE